MQALNNICERITAYEKKYGRDLGSVQLLAVTKGQPVEKIQTLIQQGQLLFAENYMQEALPKLTALQQFPIEWHFIGHIQANKTRKIAEHFSWVHSLDSKHIADRLNAQRPLNLPPLNVCIEVNVSHEAAKSGVDAHEVLALARHCLNLPRLKLRGLMTIPEHENNFDQQRASFHALLLQWQSLREQGFLLDTLSMGMSEDFEAAIAEGATIIRLGRAIFGKREARTD